MESTLGRNRLRGEDPDRNEALLTKRKERASREIELPGRSKGKRRQRQREEMLRVRRDPKMVNSILSRQT